MADSGKRQSFSEVGLMEEAFMSGTRFLERVSYPVGFSGDCSQERQMRGRRFKNFTLPLVRQA